MGFTPAFKYLQKNSLIVFERGHKAHGYVSAGEASKIPTGGPPMTTRLSVTGDLLIWTGLVYDRRYSWGKRRAESIAFASVAGMKQNWNYDHDATFSGTESRSASHQLGHLRELAYCPPPTQRASFHL